MKMVSPATLKGQSHKLLAKIIAQMKTENGKQKLKCNNAKNIT